MNKLDVSHSGKAEFFFEDIDFLHNAYKEAFSMLSKMLGSNFILWGCQPAWDNSSVGEGAVVIDKEILYYPGDTQDVSFGNWYFVLETYYDGGGQRNFYDDTGNTQRYVYQVRRAKIAEYDSQPANSIHVGTLPITPFAESLIKDSAITNAKIADAAVTLSKIANNSVSTSQIVDAAIATAKIANSAVTAAEIANLAVITSKLADSAVTTAKIANEAVTNAKIVDNNVDDSKIHAPAWNEIDFSNSKFTYKAGANAKYRVFNDVVEFKGIIGNSTDNSTEIVMLSDVDPVGDRQTLVLNENGGAYELNLRNDGLLYLTSYDTDVLFSINVRIEL